MRLFGTLTGAVTRFDRAEWLTGIFDKAFQALAAQWLVITPATGNNLTVTPLAGTNLSITPAAGGNLTITSTLRNTGD